MMESDVHFIISCLADIRSWLSAIFYLGTAWSLFYFGKWLFRDWR